MFPIWVRGFIKVRDPTASNISVRIFEHHRRSEESIGLESALARVGACCTHTGRAGGHASSWEAPRRVRTVADMGPATVRNHKSHSVRCNSTALTSHRALGAAALDTKEYPPAAPSTQAHASSRTLELAAHNLPTTSRSRASCGVCSFRGRVQQLRWTPCGQGASASQNICGLEEC